MPSLSLLSDSQANLLRRIDRPATLPTTLIVQEVDARLLVRRSRATGAEYLSWGSLDSRFGAEACGICDSVSTSCCFGRLPGREAIPVNWQPESWMIGFRMLEPQVGIALKAAGGVGVGDGCCCCCP